MRPASLAFSPTRKVKHKHTHSMKRARKHEQGKKRFTAAQIEEFRLKKKSLFFVVVKGKK